MPDDSPWQDWVSLEDGLLDNTAGFSIVTAVVITTSLRNNNSRIFSQQQRVQAAHRLENAR
jgi:hypothetical protein